MIKKIQSSIVLCAMGALIGTAVCTNLCYADLLPFPAHKFNPKPPDNSEPSHNLPTKPNVDELQPDKNSKAESHGDSQPTKVGDDQTKASAESTKTDAPKGDSEPGKDTHAVSTQINNPDKEVLKKESATKQGAKKEALGKDRKDGPEDLNKDTLAKDSKTHSKTQKSSDPAKNHTPGRPAEKQNVSLLKTERSTPPVETGNESQK